MQPTWTAILGVIAATSVASAAPTAERCQQGLDHAAKNDLPRAALYLEGCDQLELEASVATQIAKTRASVEHKLDASKLSAMTVITTPEGMLAETDAMPGERFTTPATIWTKAGDYKIHIAADAAALDASQGLTATASIEPFSRRTVIINVPQKKTAAPKDGKVDFRDEADEQASHTGPPPAQKFGSILPKKYRKPGAESTSGPLLDDPLEYRAPLVAWRLGARFGGGFVMQDNANAAPAFSVAALAARTVAGRVSFGTRLGWSHRKVDSVGLELGLGLQLVSTPSFDLAVGAGVRGEVRVQDHLKMEQVARVAIGGGVGIDLTLKSIPVTVGLRFEPSFTELSPGVRAHGFMLELGYEWR